MFPSALTEALTAALADKPPIPVNAFAVLTPSSVVTVTASQHISGSDWIVYDLFVASGTAESSASIRVTTANVK
ncbi:hypothetical protein PC128_g22537 [Phytophthora cactorum]|nr:hypothetical protein PC128_g22537 [Phytophthora cactorum]